jgi:glycolate oxidase FAD binding subunit
MEVDMPADRDGWESLLDTVLRARADGRRLVIAGAGSKNFLTPPAGELLSVSTLCHRGVISYRPEELVVTARAGTPITELESMLAASGQHLPFEPPRFGGSGTVGGMVATGLSGPGRPWSGAVRDAILGVEIINGLGERLRFGGQVMKNVAGFDVSRLQAGAFGSLGILLAVSFKVLPLPAATETRVFECDELAAQEHLKRWSRQPLPLSAACHVAGLLRVRLSGAPAALSAAGTVLGGVVDSRAQAFWRALRDGQLPDCFQPGLWRVTVPPAAVLPPSLCMNWGGAERWYRVATADAADKLVAAARAAGGSARPFAAAYGSASVDPILDRYTARLRQAFDPDGLFNAHLSTDRLGAPHAH